MLSSRLVNLLAAAAFALTLGGCAVPTHVQQPSVKKVQAGTTTVTVSITANTDQVGGLSQITLFRRVSDQSILPGSAYKDYILTQVAKDMAHDTTLFIGSLPPGQYNFWRLTDGSNPSRYIELNGSLDSFTVEEGKPLDLGRVIVTPLYEQRVLVGRSVRQRDNRALIERYSPEHLKLFPADSTVSWTQPRSEKDRAEEFAMAHPTGADCLTELADGSVVAATRMGTVLMRTPQGKWKRLPSDQIETLNCVQPVQMPGADFLAFGEFGTLLRHVPGQDKLESIDTGNLPYGNLLGLAGNVNAGWYIAVRRNRRVSIYHSAKLAGGDWSKVRGDVVRTSLIGLGSWFLMHDIGTGFVSTTPEGPLRVYDYATGQWSTRATPKGHLSSFRTSASGAWSTTVGHMGIFSPGVHESFISLDQGKSWNPMQVSDSASSIPFVQRADGALLRFDGSAFAKLGLQASTDMGKTWTSLNGSLKSRLLLPLKSGAVLGQIWDSSLPARFEFSNDGGKTWTSEEVE